MLAHNGTIFSCPALGEYSHVQEGRTDSERILCHIVDIVSRAQAERGRDLTPEERFVLVDEAVCRMAPRNKLNLLFYDGELMFRGEIVDKSIQILRSHGKSDEEIKEMMLLLRQLNN